MISHPRPSSSAVIRRTSTADAFAPSPVTAAPGTEVFSGMLNLDGKLVLEATADRDNSLLAEITRLVEAGEQSRSRYVRLADRAAKLYVPVVHSLAALTLLGWLVIGQDAHLAIIHAIAVLIITCPCALGLAVPAVLKALKAVGVASVLIEGGGQVAAAFLRAGAVDCLEWFRAPILLGGEGRPCVASLALAKLAEAPNFRRLDVRPVGNDLWESYVRI